MKCIATNIKKSFNEKVFADAEKEFAITIKQTIKDFIKLNAGGYPVKDIVSIDGEDYEVRVFLSADKEDTNYYIAKPMNYFLKKTKNKIIPIGLDSGDNYYCVNNDTEKVYFWSAGEDQYYCIANNLDEFAARFE